MPIALLSAMVFKELYSAFTRLYCLRNLETIARMFWKILDKYGMKSFGRLLTLKILIWKVMMLVLLMSHSESELNANEEQRPNFFKQILDPLLRRKMSGWRTESQIFYLQNLCYDPGRVTGFQRLNMKSGDPSILHVVI